MKREKESFMGKLRFNIWQLIVVVCITILCTFFMGYKYGVQQQQQIYQQENENPIISELMKELYE